MAAAVITAFVGVIGAVLVFLLNRQNQYQFGRRQALLARVNAQLRELYGPLHALVRVNELVWDSLRDNAVLPPRAERVDARQLEEHEVATWKAWLSHSLMPANQRMRDLILQHADLIIEAEMPGPLFDFCAHVSAYEVLLSEDGSGGTAGNRLIGHPGDAYVDYVDRSFAALKIRQDRLIALTASGDAPGSDVLKPRSVQNKSLLPERSVVCSLRKRARRAPPRCHELKPRRSPYSASRLAGSVR